MKVQLGWCSMGCYAYICCYGDVGLASHVHIVTTGFHECSHATMSHAMVGDTRCWTGGDDCALVEVIPILTLSSASRYCQSDAVAFVADPLMLEDWEVGTTSGKVAVDVVWFRVIPPMSTPTLGFSHEDAVATSACGSVQVPDCQMVNSHAIVNVCKATVCGVSSHHPCAVHIGKRRQEQHVAHSCSCMMVSASAG